MRFITSLESKITETKLIDNFIYFDSFYDKIYMYEVHS